MTVTWHQINNNYTYFKAIRNITISLIRYNDSMTGNHKECVHVYDMLNLLYMCRIC